MVISIKRNEWTYQMTDSHRSQNAALIQTNKDRRAQLDQIADIFGTKTPNETLGAIIRSFADQGLISGDIPGLKVNVASDGIVIRMDAGQPVGLSVDAAQSLIATLRAYIDGTQLSDAARPCGLPSPWTAVAAPLDLMSASISSPIWNALLCRCRPKPEKAKGRMQQHPALQSFVSNDTGIIADARS